MNIDARTMKKITMDGCAGEILSIEEMIRQQAMKGRLSLIVHELSPAVKTHLEDNGFEVITTLMSNQSIYNINWEKDYNK